MISIHFFLHYVLDHTKIILLNKSVKCHASDQNFHFKFLRVKRILKNILSVVFFTFICQYSWLAFLKFQVYFF